MPALGCIALFSLNTEIESKKKQTFRYTSRISNVSEINCIIDRTRAITVREKKLLQQASLRVICTSEIRLNFIRHSLHFMQSVHKIETDPDYSFVYA
jgi:hypothetical protein